MTCTLRAESTRFSRWYRRRPAPSPSALPMPIVVVWPSNYSVYIPSARPTLTRSHLRQGTQAPTCGRSLQSPNALQLANSRILLTDSSHAARPPHALKQHIGKHRNSPYGCHSRRIKQGRQRGVVHGQPGPLTVHRPSPRCGDRARNSVEEVSTVRSWETETGTPRMKKWSIRATGEVNHRLALAQGRTGI